MTSFLMDGYVDVQTRGLAQVCSGSNATKPVCLAMADGVAHHDVMGYHTADEIPNYWAYAQNYVLQDRMFAGVRSWSLAAHLDLTSQWVAKCKGNTKALTCQTWPTAALPNTTSKAQPNPFATTQYPWANLFQLLDLHKVSWKYYLSQGTEPDCDDDAMTCAPVIQKPGLLTIWNLVPGFKYVKQQGSAYLQTHNPSVDQFLIDARAGTLPQVSWVVPSSDYSEHPTAGVTKGMEYVTGLINAVMASPNWSSSAIFISWDDWGGFYDHAPPPNVDRNGSPNPVQGYGLRVPGLMISPYARQGMIDHAVLSTNSYATFFENLFMGGARLDPVALGNPDKRPTIRDALTQVTLSDGTTAPIGDLMNEFDFTQPPRAPMFLSTRIPTGIKATCSATGSQVCTSSTISLTWDAVHGQGGHAGPVTYHIQRDGADLSQCTGRATVCLDTPGAGPHLYRAYTVDGSGASSPLSAAAEADAP